MMKPLGTQELVTGRLLLRKIKKEDAESLYAAGCLGETLQEAVELVENMMKYNDDPFTFHWALEYQGKAVGRIKGWEIHPQHNYIQLGYDIGATYRCMGLMTEAVQAVCAYLLKECDFNRVYCMVRESNLASMRVCEKAGMQHEGFLRNHWQEPDGTYINVHYYGMLLSDLP